MKTNHAIALCLLASSTIALAAPRSSANYSISAEIADAGGLRAASASYTNDGSAGLINGISDSAPGPTVIKSGYVAQLDSDNPGSAVEILSVVSRKTHGGAGTFDINLPRTGPPGIECRTGGAGGIYRVVVTFGSPVTVGGVSIMSRDGLASATRSVSGAAVTVDLSAVANAQTLGITLTNVSNGGPAGNIFVPMGVLVGDTTGNGSVTTSDIGQTKAQSGQAVTGTNFRSDVTVNGGTINTSDIGLVKSKSGTQLP